MSEATEFLVFCSALRETPSRLERFVERVGDERVREVLERMAEEEELALARLQALLGGETDLPAEHPARAERGEPLERFLAARRLVLTFLDTVGGPTLHLEGRLPSGRPLDPWRLAGNLADHDVQSLAELRSLVNSGD